MRLRKTVLEGTDLQNLLDLYEEWKTASQRLASGGLASRPGLSARFALFFCENFNFFNKDYVNHRREKTDGVSWATVYRRFHRLVEARCLVEDAGSIGERFRRECLPFGFDFERAAQPSTESRRAKRIAVRHFLDADRLARLTDNYRALRNAFPDRRFLYGDEKLFFAIRQTASDSLCRLTHWMGTLPADKTPEHVKAILAGDPGVKNRVALEPEYQKGRQALSDFERNPAAAKGVFQNLAPLLDEVLAEHFPEFETRPRIFWLPRFAVAKLAHFDFSRDEIGVSLIFDLPLPVKPLLRFLIHHELLHRKLGVKLTRNRRWAHTPRFKALETRYPCFEDVETELASYASGKFLPPV